METKVVLITWKDAALFSNIVADKSEAEEKANTAIVKQTGFLISEDREKVIIGWQMHTYNSKYRHIASIPRTSIIKIEVLKEQNKNN